jgi:cold shock CspA family protein
MLWFNAVKDLGAILTEDGERLTVHGSGFTDGKRPEGRCAKAVVSFAVMESEGERHAQEVVLVPDEPQRRARYRHPSIRGRP